MNVTHGRRTSDQGKVDMRLYLDTADLSQWDALLPTGMFYGITTNPLLAQRAGLRYGAIDWRDMAQRATDLGAWELHGQITGDRDTALRFADTLYNAGQRAEIKTVVKIPLTPFGIGIASHLKSQGGAILMTACYSAKQYVTAGAIGADYIAPYYGRMLDQGIDAARVMADMAQMMHNTPCRPLVASLRTCDQITDLARLGFDCFTLSPDLSRALMRDDHTQTAAQDFERAAQ